MAYIVPKPLVDQVVTLVKAVERQVTNDYRMGIYKKEDQLTGALVSQLNRALENVSILGIKVLAVAFGQKEEILTGADLAVMLNVDFPDFRLSKVFIAQAKKCECFKQRGYTLSDGNIDKRLIDQIKKMIDVTTSAFVMIFTRNFNCGILLFPAGDILALNGRISCRLLTGLYHAHLYDIIARFLKCHIGDPRISAKYWGPKGLRQFISDYNIRYGLLLQLISERRRLDMESG